MPAFSRIFLNGSVFRIWPLVSIANPVKKLTSSYNNNKFIILSSFISSGLKSFISSWRLQQEKAQNRGKKQTNISLYLLKKKTLMVGKIEGKRKRGQQRMIRLDSNTDSMDMNRSKLQETVKDRKPGMLHPWGPKESDTTASEQQSIFNL